MQADAKPTAAPSDDVAGSEPALIKMNNQASSCAEGLPATRMVEECTMPMNDVASDLSESITQVADDVPVAQCEKNVQDSAPA